MCGGTPGGLMREALQFRECESPNRFRVVSLSIVAAFRAVESDRASRRCCAKAVLYALYQS